MGDASGTRSFPFGTLCAVLAVVGLTALPFVSCGIIDFKGHELLRNKPPDLAAGDLAKKLDLPEGLTSSNSPPPPSPGRPDGLPEGKGWSTTHADRDQLFTGGDSWLHWVYLAALVLAAVAVFLPSRPRALTLVGVAGLAAVVAFLLGFNSMLGRESKEGLSMSIKLEMGAYLTLAAFAGIAIHGWRSTGRSDTG